MAYKLLGMAVWKVAKLFLRRKYGSYTPGRPLIAGGVVAIALGALLFAQRRGAQL